MDPHDLYGLPLERFVPERAALSRELRQAGQRDEAEAVGKLRKPSLAAWAVNQIVRTQGRSVETLFAAGDAARQAQSDLLAGRRSGEALRDALTREREAVNRLVGVARGLLTTEGHELSPVMLERVSDTLHAAALDEEARAQVEAGCLDRELRHVGLGPGATGAAAAGAGSRRRTKTAARDVTALRRAETQARRTLNRAAHDVETAEARRDAATESLREAEEALTDAQERLREAKAAHRDAERNLGSG